MLGVCGFFCFVEKCMFEKIDFGEFVIFFMKDGDMVYICMFDEDGNNIFGFIE